MDFHSRLIKIRKDLGYTMREVYEALDVSRATYERWETHCFPRTPETYGRLAEVLEVSLEYLMFGRKTIREKEEAFNYFVKFMDILK